MAYRSNFITEIQKLVGVDADGIIGPGTEAAIEAAGGLKGLAELMDAAPEDVDEAPEPEEEIVEDVDTEAGLALLEVMQSQLGVTEADNPETVASYGGGDTQTPWCAHSINWALDQIGKPGTGSGAAKSFANYGVACKPQPGAIIGWGRPSHVAVVEQVDGDRITVISGNMSNAVKRHPVTSGWGFNEPPAFVRMPV